MLNVIPMGEIEAITLGKMEAGDDEKESKKIL